MNALSASDLRNRKPSRDEYPQLPKHPVAMVLDNLTSGFNVGAAFRLADALRLERLCLCGTTPVPPRPRIRHTSMGTERWVPYQHFVDGRTAVGTLTAEGFRPVAVELTDTATSIEDYSPAFPTALVFGDEMCGVASSTLGVCEDSVYIPMYGMGNSMSVVAAMAIAAHHFVAAYRRSANPAAIR